MLKRRERGMRNPFEQGTIPHELTEILRDGEWHCEELVLMSVKDADGRWLRQTVKHLRECDEVGRIGFEVRRHAGRDYLRLKVPGSE